MLVTGSTIDEINKALQQNQQKIDQLKTKINEQYPKYSNIKQKITDLKAAFESEDRDVNCVNRFRGE